MAKCKIAPRLQWRHRDGFAPSSPTLASYPLIAPSPLKARFSDDRDTLKNVDLLLHRHHHAFRPGSVTRGSPETGWASIRTSH